MKTSLTAGITHAFKYTVPESKTVPHLYPEAAEFQKMPQVFATGFLVGLIEWTCIQAINPHIDWPEEQTVGIGINLNHTAATPPGLTVTVTVHLVEVAGKRLVFEFEADDGIDSICKGSHERFVINSVKFAEKLKAKIKPV
jgi:fluoroacetyl-CoA thioesterase